MTRRWTTPVIWLAFTAIATVVGLVSVSVVRHAVVATSLRSTSASDVTAVLGSSSPTPTPAPASPTTRATSAPRPSVRPTHTVTKPVPTPTYSPSPTGGGTTPTTAPPPPPPPPTPTPTPNTDVFTQAFPQGTVSVACTADRAQLIYITAAPNYQQEWAPNRRGGFDFNFQPADGNDTGRELSVSVSCSSGVANWYVRD